MKKPISTENSVGFPIREIVLFLFVFLSGKVPPEVSLPNRRIGQTLGRDTVLECVITSSPQAIYYWEKDGQRITSSSKHSVDAYDEADHTLVLSLRVRQLTPSDYGTYNCVASNSLGVAQRAMTLYGKLLLLMTVLHRLVNPLTPTVAIWLQL